jgi:hypothetical protein
MIEGLKWLNFKIKGPKLQNGKNMSTKTAIKRNKIRENPNSSHLLQ